MKNSKRYTVGVYGVTTRDHVTLRSGEKIVGRIKDGYGGAHNVVRAIRKFNPLAEVKLHCVPEPSIVKLDVDVSVGEVESWPEWNTKAIEAWQPPIDPSYQAYHFVYGDILNLDPYMLKDAHGIRSMDLCNTSLDPKLSWERVQAITPYMDFVFCSELEYLIYYGKTPQHVLPRKGLITHSPVSVTFHPVSGVGFGWSGNNSKNFSSINPLGAGDALAGYFLCEYLEKGPGYLFDPTAPKALYTECQEFIRSNPGTFTKKTYHD